MSATELRMIAKWLRRLVRDDMAACPEDAEMLKRLAAWLDTQATQMRKTRKGKAA